MLWVSLAPGLCHGREPPGSDPCARSPQATCGGVLRGTGRQKLGAMANAVGYYTIGFPIGISLMFAAKMGVLGTCALQLACHELCSAKAQPWNSCPDLPLPHWGWIAHCRDWGGH